jgi:dienelactone hydrolase
MTKIGRSAWALVLAAGLAGASSGVRAEGDVESKALEYRHGDVVLEGYLARPTAGGGAKRPGVIVVPAWKGLDDQARHSAERLARLGYVAFAVDMYGKGIRPETNQDAARESGTYKNDRPLTRARVKAGLDRLLQEPDVDPKRVGVIGYCFGGMVALELARSGADVAAVVTFHGALDTPTPDDMKNAKAKILACHGANDPFVTQEIVAKFVEEMRATGLDWQLMQFGNAVHSFTNENAGSDPSTGQAYNEPAARRAWAAMVALFRETFGA